MNQGFNTVIESIGVYLPPKIVSTREMLQGCKRKVRFPMERMTGIKSRRMAGETEFSIDLAKKAAADCLAMSRHTPQDIDLVICCNISRCDEPGFRFTAEPSTAVKLRKHFGFSNALAFDITNACTGMWTGIYIVDSFLKAGLIRCGMVVSGEYITHLALTAQQEIKGFMDTRLACLTLGDAGAALILETGTSSETGLKAIEMFSLGKYSPFCIAKPSEESLGSIMLTELIKLSAVTLKYALMFTESMRQRSGWAPEAIDHFIMHQVSKTALDDARRQINKLYGREVCTEENVINNLAERGNTASTSHFVALKDFILGDKIQSGQNLLFTATGSGLTIGAAFYRLDDLPDRVRRQEIADVKLAGVQNKIEKPAVPVIAGPKIRIESIGIIPPGQVVEKQTIALVKAAFEDCLERSSYQRSDIDLLIFAGVYRSDYIFEPAIAPMITGELKINDAINAPGDKKTFAFDIFNGAIGFLNACHTAAGLIHAKKAKRAVIAAAEVENNALDFPGELYGLEQTGSVMILDESPGGSAGFGGFVFRYFSEYQDALKAMINSGIRPVHLEICRDGALDDYYIACIPGVVQELLEREGLDMSQINVIFPPQLSSSFILKLSEKMNILPGKFVDTAQAGRDFFTSSPAYALRYAQENGQAAAGDIGLIIAVGSGIQVGCAVYYF